MSNFRTQVEHPHLSARSVHKLIYFSHHNLVVLEEMFIQHFHPIQLNNKKPLKLMLPIQIHVLQQVMSLGNDFDHLFLIKQTNKVYLSRTLALFLASIDNPPANTVNGTSTNGICRPPFSLVKSIFQSTSIPVNLYNSENLATAAQQGAGLVNAYQALGVNTFFSPSELSLNDTTRKAQSYTVTLRNIGNQTTSYKLTHVGASLLTGKKANDDQLMSSPIQSADYAVSIN